MHFSGLTAGKLDNFPKIVTNFMLGSLVEALKHFSFHAN